MFEPGSPAWHELRRTRLGGSEIAPVLGLSPWDSLYTLWHRKLGLIGPVETTTAMATGTALEPWIIDQFAQRHPHLELELRPGTWVHNLDSWMLANPDALARNPLTGEVAVIEAKFSGVGRGFGPEEHGEHGIPIYYRTQVQWYLAVLGLPVAYLIVFIGALAECRVYAIEANAGEQEFMRECAREFMVSLDARRVPDLDSTSSTYATVRELHPEIDDRDIELDAVLADDYLEAHVQFDRIQRIRAELTTRVAAAIGTGRRGVITGDDGTYRVVARRQAKTGGTPYLVRATQGEQTTQQEAA